MYTVPGATGTSLLHWLNWLQDWMPCILPKASPQITAYKLLYALLYCSHLHTNTSWNLIWVQKFSTVPLSDVDFLIAIFESINGYDKKDSKEWHWCISISLLYISFNIERVYKYKTTINIKLHGNNWSVWQNDRIIPNFLEYSKVLC